jgi:hypothetical protein
LPWGRLDDKANGNPKLLALSDSAWRMWGCGLIFCQSQLTDGFILADAIHTFGVRAKNREAVADELCRVLVPGRGPLWERVEGGYHVHDYLDWNDSREAIESKRERDRKRKGFRAESPRKGSGKRAESDRPITITTTIEDQEQEQESPEPLPAAGPAVLVFPVVGGPERSWSLTAEQVEEWAGLFPSLDVVAEARKALAWVRAHQSKRKTARGMPAFLVRWLSRTNDLGGGSRAPEKRTAEQYSGSASDWFEECRRLHGGACSGRSQHSTQLVIDKGRAERSASQQGVA